MTEFNELLTEAFPDKRIVPGSGLKTARLVLIGEAPGEQEDKLLQPFVGKAGRNLDEFLRISGIDRSLLYITNTVKFRPTAQGKRGPVNRKPTREEIAAFRPWLLKELELIHPFCAATLGNVPLQALTGDGTTIGAVHGTFLRCGSLLLYPMYHPASVIYNPSLREAYLRDAMALGAWLREQQA